MYLLGYDVGSSSVKASLIDADSGMSVASAFHPKIEMKIDAPKAGWAEQDPENWWANLILATNDVLQTAEIDPSAIKAIGISYQMHGLVLVDKDHKPVQNAYNLMDKRALREVDWLKQEIGEKAIFEISKNRLEDHPMITNLLWEKNNRPDTFKSIYKALTIDGFINLKLTGRTTCHYSGAAFYGVAYDLLNRRFSQDMLDRVGIPNPELQTKAYPFQLSGGMRQRVMIAMALALDPEILIADEPTTALDVTVQAQIMSLLGDLQAETGMGLILITHDLGVVAEVADEVVVMYAGREVERGPSLPVYHEPAHPYTIGLMNSLPRSDVHTERLVPITGSPPDLMHIPTGCAFGPRCPYVQEICRTDTPELDQVAAGRIAACHFSKEVQNG